MKKKIILYTTSFALLGILLVFFTKAYNTMKADTELSSRHNSVQSIFQTLAKQINNAAILNPDLITAINEANRKELFYTDSAGILEQLNLLQETVHDSVNIRIAAQLVPLVKTEISWLLRSNVPDSIIHKKATVHIAAFRSINSLITEGIQRTNFLISYRRIQLNEEIKKVRFIIIMFVVLAGVLLIVTTINFFKQQSKTKLKEAELEIVLNRINDGVVSVDNNWRYTFLNDAAIKAHPLGKKETIGQLMWDIHPELKNTVFWEKYYEAMLTKKVVEIENYYAPLNTWFSVKVYPSEDGLTIFYKDVTESKKAEQLLTQSLKEVTDYKFALDEASIVAITDQKGIIKHANQNFCDISKYKLEELIGQDHRIINSGHHPKEFIRNLWTTIANGKIWKGELKNKAKDGTIYWVDTTIVPFLDENKKPYQYVAIRADITEKKAATEKLSKSEKIYKTIASNIPGSVICLLDTDFRYSLIEGDMLEKLGYTKEKLLGNKASDVLPPEIFATVKDEFSRVLEGETISKESARGSYDLLTRFIPLKDENNSVYGIMTVAIDVSSLKKAQRDITELNHNLEATIKIRTEQLRKSNEELEAFSYSVSHDLRAPLRGIIGFAAILEEDYGNKLDKEATRVIHVIKNNTIKMGQLIDDLLGFSRMSKQELLKTIIDTNEIVNEIINELSHNNNKISWKVQDLPAMNADRNTIRQVWINFLSNAVKYSSNVAQPVISIEGHRQNDEVVFSIRDNGVGFDEEYSDKLFKVFQRLHDTEEFEGTGIGLALAEKIISKHGGRVRAEGKPGQGACFYFSLPL